MSVSGISSGGFSDYGTQSLENAVKAFLKDFKQLGQDLQSGNMSAAQQDFVTLQQDMEEGSSSAAPQSQSPIEQAFSQLAQDLQSGNLTAAQQDFSTIQQDLRAEGGHQHQDNDVSGSSNGTSEVSQLLTELGQALQAGNLNMAQQVYTTLQADLQQFSQAGGEQASSGPGSGSLSVSA